jgi:hypothetical protein
MEWPSSGRGSTVAVHAPLLSPVVLLSITFFDLLAPKDFWISWLSYLFTFNCEPTWWWLFHKHQFLSGVCVFHLVQLHVIMFLVQYFSVYKMFSLPLSPISRRGFDHVIYVICILPDDGYSINTSCTLSLISTLIFSLLTVSLPDNGYSINTSCTLSLISTLIFSLLTVSLPDDGYSINTSCTLSLI